MSWKTKRFLTTLAMPVILYSACCVIKWEMIWPGSVSAADRFLFLLIAVIASTMVYTYPGWKWND